MYTNTHSIVSLRLRCQMLSHSCRSLSQKKTEKNNNEKHSLTAAHTETYLYNYVAKKKKMEIQNYPKRQKTRNKVKEISINTKMKIRPSTSISQRTNIFVYTRIHTQRSRVVCWCARHMTGRQYRNAKTEWKRPDKNWPVWIEWSGKSVCVQANRTLRDVRRWRRPSIHAQRTNFA